MMSFFDPEKLNNAQKANFCALQQISSKIFETFGTFSQLQLKQLQSFTNEHFEGLHKLLSVHDLHGFSKLQASLVQTTAQVEHMQVFNREVYELISSAQSEIAKLASEQAQEWVDVISKNAPAGSEPVAAAFKSAMGNATSVYEHIQKTAQQAAEVVAAATSMEGQARETGKAAGGNK